MDNAQKASYEQRSAEELNAELRRLKDSLQDLEETYTFTFCRTSVHIGAEKALCMQVDHENECREHRLRIAEIEEILKKRR